MSSDKEHVDELFRESIGGMTRELASELVKYIDHESTEVRKKAIQAFERKPLNQEEKEAIDYDEVVSKIAKVMRGDIDWEFKLMIADVLSFFYFEEIGGHAPETITEFTESDRGWVTDLLKKDELIDNEFFLMLACRILSHIGKPEDIDRLEELAETDDLEGVRKEAKEAINEIS